MAFTRIWTYAIPILCLVGIGAVIFLFLGPNGGTGTSRSVSTRTLLLLADEELRHPLVAPDMEHEAGLVGRFQRRYGRAPQVEYISPEQLVERLAVGQSGDVYLTGDDISMNQAVAAGLVDEVQEVAWRVPIILVRSDNPRGIESVADLARPDLRLGVAGEQSGLISRVTTEIFEKQGIPMDRLNDSIRFTGNSAAEVARAVDQNRVDAAIVWRNIGQRYSRNTWMLAIPEEDNVLVPVRVAVVTNSPNSPTASQLAGFLAGGASAHLFQLYGFDLNQEETTLDE